MSKKIRKTEELQIGKCYRLHNGYVRIDEFDVDNEPFGVDISIEKDTVWIFKNRDLSPYFWDTRDLEEITKEEFEQKLQEAQEHFTKMINQVKNNENEETTA